MHIRPATTQDLDAINRIITNAVSSWNLPGRVKRLVIPTYHYNDIDLQHLHIDVAEDTNHIVGVAAWEEAADADMPPGKSGILLHGIYVEPSAWHSGIGSNLFHSAEQAVIQQAKDGLLVKAQQDANGFFVKMGMQPLAVENEQRDYANRYWKTVGV